MGVGRTALFLVPVALVARGIGFVVPIVIAGWFGVQPATDAFFFALSVPSFLLVLASNAMGTVVVPPLAQLRVNEPARLPGVVTGASLLAAGLTTLAGAFFALLVPHALPRFTAFDAATQAMAVRFTWELLPFVAGVGAISVVRAACEGLGAFRAAGFSPVARSVAIIGVVAAGRDTGPAILPLALSLGAATELLWLWGVLAREGVWPGRPSWPAPMAVAAAAFGPVLAGETMVALNLVVDKAFAAGLPEGSVTILEYADRARLIPQTLLESSLVVVAFQAWATARAKGDPSAERAAVQQSLRWVFLLAPPALAGMVVAREVLVRTLFSHGAFPEWGVDDCASALAAFVPGIFASLVGTLLVKAHIVAGRYRLVMGLGVVSFVLNAALNAIFREPLGLTGLALSTSVTTVCVTAWSWSRLQIGRPALDGLAVLGLATLGAVSLFEVEPASLLDPALYLAALPFLGLLAVGAHRARGSA
ncbi:MAG: hypothetical protein FJ090_15455 [Deltaproteobacteria bacterium]|nr:hypothetical protein [Deltaproteobacteria bacterium]